MAVDVQTKQQQPFAGDPIVNDFAFSVATKNGSGSQTSNNVLVKSLFMMGIPVNGKNLFPSNIKGLPTWYTIRVSKDGYTARRATTEIVVAYNQSTAAEDIQNLPAGGVCVIPQDWKWTQSREDIIYYEVPIKELLAQAEFPKEFQDRITNMTYVGVLAQLVGIPMDVIYEALLDNFNRKEKPAKMNMAVVELAYKWAEENLVKADPYRVEKMDKTQGKIMITGNEAGALGALFGGVSVIAWYPITPSTSMIDAAMTYQYLRKDPDTGKNTIAIVQAEDELAAIGILVGAGWAGARSMTATSGPGLSLMAEFTGLAYFAEVPCVIWDITRMGPSTGLPTRTSQGDLLFAHFLGHGDTRQICLIPSSPEEAFEFGWRAHDIADKYQTPVIVLSDLDLGMNNWMADPFEYPTEPINHGKVLNAEQLQAFIDEHGKWGRHWDVDGDGIPYRTVPGTNHPMAGYLARGTGHNAMALYSERSDDWVENMTRIRNKIQGTRKTLPQPVADINPDHKIGLLSYGTNNAAIEEARDRLSAEGINTNYMRVRSLPLAQSVTDFIRQHDRVYVIENNFDGQLHQLINLEHSEDTTHVISLALGDSLPMTAGWVVSKIQEAQ